jgi:RNA polymerase sigma-70 factor (ECF subfamily)
MRTKKDPNEGALIQASIEGDGKAFEGLYVRYMQAIYRYIFFRVGDEGQAEDLTEETFLRAWEALPKYQHRKHPFSSWLYRIAHNLIIDYYRRVKPVPISNGLMRTYSNPAETLDRMVDRKHEIQLLVKAVQRLNELEKEIVLLRFVEGLSHKEIAAMVGRSQSSCRVILHRALKALRSRLAELEGRS